MLSQTILCNQSGRKSVIRQLGGLPGFADHGTFTAVNCDDRLCYAANCRVSGARTGSSVTSLWPNSEQKVQL